jgi:hypothetical protein
MRIPHDTRFCEVLVSTSNCLGKLGESLARPIVKAALLLRCQREDLLQFRGGQFLAQHTDAICGLLSLRLGSFGGLLSARFHC